MVKELWYIICDSNIIYLDNETIRDKNNAMLTAIPNNILDEPNMVSVYKYDIEKKILHLKRN